MAGDPRTDTYAGEAPVTPGPRSGARDTSAEQYFRLRHELMMGRYPPGTLLQETALSAAYGISRTPVRDALARLEQDGLLRRAPRGYRVRERTPEEVLDVYEARIVLESHAAAVAAIRHTPLDLARLRQIVSEAADTTDGDQLWRCDTDFHAALRQAAHNSTIAETLYRLDAQMTVHGPYRQRRSDLAAVTLAEHEGIVAAVAARDQDLARSRLTEHLTRVRDLRVTALLGGE
ncbi:GntR family transcriptional regulator [Streptomyces radicis]|uniref:GntR family transcriptional regulator n=1 Tax=Streptomyces radicis TaxID=1750517 RepID=A0A3A9WN75_9ACTN|nr:GntR family transcriptional regulator [Streptomyces radicis]RKN10914.1 GntR family transcriptional regulator [Streptomyces radicis]RKN25177.1 GntR family transcriptional regulator [Streptomyces radicis]